MPDVTAAIGLAQLERAETLRRKRERCDRFYMDRLAGIPEIDLPRLRVGFGNHAWRLFPIVLTAEAAVSRNRCIEMLADRGIGRYCQKLCTG